jgi:hypothetical protein
LVGAFQTLVHDLHNEFHEIVGFFGEAEADKGVDGKGAVADPGVAVVPVSGTAKVFGEGKGGGCDEGSCWFVR